MADKLFPKETQSIEEGTISSSYEITALLNILVSKGLITREEFLEEVRKLHVEAHASGLQTAVEPYTVKD